MKIKTRLQISIIFCFVMAVSIGLFLFMAVQDMNGKSEETTIAATIVKDIAELKILAHEYLLHPGERPLKQWKSKYDFITKYITRKANKFNSPNEKIVLDKILQNLVRFETVFSGLIIDLGKEQGLGRQKDPMSPELRNRLIGEMLVKSQATVSPIFQLQQTVQAELVSAQKRTSLLIFFFLVILTAIITVILLWINKSIGAPIAKLHKGTEIIGSGNLDYKVGIDAKDEIGQLSRSFDEMTEELKETTVSKEYVENIIKSMIDSLVVVTAEGAIQTVNQATCELLEYRPEELIGQPIGKIFIEEEEEEEEEVQELFHGTGLQELIKRGFIKGLERTYLTKDGSRIPVLFSGSVMRDIDGRIQGIICLASDISGIKQIEEKVHEKDIQFRKLSSNVPDLIFQFTRRPDGTYCVPIASEGIKNIFGCSPEDVLDDFTPIGKVIYPEDAERVINDIEYSAKHLTYFMCEFRVQIPGKPIQWIYSRSTPEKLPDGSITWFGFNADITDRKRAEVEREKLQAQLQQSQKMESIGTLAGGIAHDFNNLLYPIIGFAEMLKEDLPPDSPEHDSAQEIFNAGRRGGELVKQILAFSRQTEHKLSPVRFQKILTEVCKLTRSTIPSDIKIHLDIQKDCGLVMAESTQLHQIAMNLITNAYHAVEKTSGEISIQLKEIILDNDDLKDSPLQPGQYVMLSVSDNGVGIPKEIMNNIFEPYFTTKEKGKGTGLGLAVVYGILTEHKGDIKVYSEEGKGTTFNVYLPLMKKSNETISTEKELNKLTGTERILLVDDEESVVRLEKLMLERLGYNVSALSNSLEALETFNSNPDGYDLVISDMTMPNMTGDKLARELMSIRPDIPVIICTGFSERINKEQAEANKVKGFLMKPVVKSEMAQMVRKVLDEAKIS